MKTLGVRYEYPGDPFNYLRDLNGRILAANGNNPLFRLGPLPETDTNNLMPRIGFNWNPRTGKKGITGFFTEGDKLVVSGGYARTYDPIFMNLVVNMGSSFPFVSVNADAGCFLSCPRYDGAGFVSGESLHQICPFGRPSLSGDGSNID